MSEERKTPFHTVRLLINKIQQDFVVEQKGIDTKTRVMSLNNSATNDMKNGIEDNKKYGCKTSDLILATHVYHTWLTFPIHIGITQDTFVYQYVKLILNSNQHQHKNTR
jgi:hypothetical protein